MFTLLIVYNTSFAQNQGKQSLLLIEKNDQEGEGVIIKESTIIKVWTKSNLNKPSSGRLKVLNDSTILVRNDSIYINDIVKLRNRSVTESGPEFFLAGMGVILLIGSATFVLITEYWIGLRNALIISSPVWTIGTFSFTMGIIKIDMGKKYELTEWEICVY